MISQDRQNEVLSSALGHEPKFSEELKLVRYVPKSRHVDHLGPLMEVIELAAYRQLENNPQYGIQNKIRRETQSFQKLYQFRI